MKKITIINAYGEKNIGDAAILKVAVEFINERYGNCNINILTENGKSFSDFSGNLRNVSISQLPYGYAIRGAKKIGGLEKIIRFLEIYINSVGIVILDNFLNITISNKGFYKYIRSIKEADLIIGMGGGYFTTNNQFKDYFGLMLSLLPVYISKFYKKKIIFFPMSIGPFASDMQKQITFSALESTTVIARDQITMNMIKKSSKNIYTLYGPDLALFLPALKSKIGDKLKSTYMVLTAREWLSKDKQKNYESSLVKLIENVWEKYHLNTIFVAMARNKIEDDDNQVSGRIKGKLKNKKIFKTYTPKSIEDMQDLLSKARLAVCTRMHSAILSITVRNPFIAIGYGHKTLGLVQSYEIEKYHVDIHKVDDLNVNNLVEELLIQKNYKEFINTISKNQEKKMKYKKNIINTLPAL